MRRGDWAGCIAGALSLGEYEAMLADAGFDDVSVSFAHEVADGPHGAIVRARKPADAPGLLGTMPSEERLGALLRRLSPPAP